MIKITSLEIDGFINPLQKVKLDFVDSNIICIYGDNGSGKTSFLEILFAVFSRDEEILKKHNVSKVSIATLEEEHPCIVEKIENTEKWQNILLEEIDYIHTDINTYTHDMESQYYWSQIEESGLKNISSLFLGIGRGIHRKELDIPRQTLWHFFRVNKKISEDKILIASEIDDFTDKLVNHLTNANIIESNKAKEFDNKKNIYLPYIEIDTIEAFLMSKYKEAVLDAKDKIETALFKTSLNSFKANFQSVSMDLEDLKEKLIYNRSLLLEMFSKDDDMGIETVFNSLDKDEKFLEQIGNHKQIILSTIINELQSEVELFKEIQLFVDEYNSFLNYNKNLVLSSNGIFITPQKHSIDRLSSGERHLLTFLATILLMGEEQDFILLDEPEISLNVDWQRKILSTIERLAPNAQVIVATHSPLVIEDYPQSLIKIELARL